MSEGRGTIEVGGNVCGEGDRFVMPKDTSLNYVIVATGAPHLVFNKS